MRTFRFRRALVLAVLAAPAIGFAQPAAYPSKPVHIVVPYPAGIDADFDCKVGECGSCLTTVLEGAPIHRDYYLNARERAENKSICTCVSRAKGPRLVLDL